MKPFLVLTLHLWHFTPILNYLGNILFKKVSLSQFLVNPTESQTKLQSSLVPNYPLFALWLPFPNEINDRNCLGQWLSIRKFRAIEWCFRHLVLPSPPYLTYPPPFAQSIALAWTVTQKSVPRCAVRIHTAHVKHINLIRGTRFSRVLPGSLGKFGVRQTVSSLSRVKTTAFTTGINPSEMFTKTNEIYWQPFVSCAAGGWKPVYTWIIEMAVLASVFLYGIFSLLLLLYYWVLLGIGV